MFVKNFRDYNNILKRVPQCTRFVERKLVYRFIKNSCLKSGRLLVLMNLICVFRVSTGYTRSGIAGSDLLQEGIIGLMKAIIRFNPDYGVRLSTFSFFWIKKGINEFIFHNKRTTITEQTIISLIPGGVDVHSTTNDYFLMYNISTIGLKLSSSLERLKMLNRCLVTGRFLFNNKLTLNELSLLHDISLERVRQINVGTLKLLRNFLN